jgi:2'-5' RNA ligase
MEDQPDYSDGCMLALYPGPALAAELAIPGGLAAAELHVTVAYLGNAADVDLAGLTAAAEKLLDRPAAEAVIGGHGRFTGAPQDVIIALLDGPALEDLRRDTLTALSDAGIDVPREHGYTAHLTLRYQDPGDPDPVGRLIPQPVTFTHLSVVHGGNRTNLPFRDGAETAHPVLPYAREAYMAGWAASGGPFTRRVLAGCDAAARWAARHADRPDVFEVALKLGQLEGAWAVVYRRRHDTIRDKTAPVMTAWRSMVHRLNARSLVSRYRALGGLYGETADPHRKNRKTEATAVTLAWLYGILDDPGYDEFTAEIEEALQAGLAEGDVGARLIAAEEAGVAAGDLDTDAMFTDAYAALADLPSLPGMAAEWAQQIIAGCAADVGQALASLLKDGASYADMLDTIMRITGGTDVRAVYLLMDYAISAAYAKGALSLFTTAGVTQVNWVTASDTRVCPVCEDNADQGPYTPQQFPPCPAHPLCVIGSTRVAVPGPVVTADVPRHFAGTGVDSTAGLASTSASTVAERDFGRGHIRAITDRYYVGDVITIRTSAGHELTATPNHPVATRCGWVPIAELTVGEHVLCSTGPEWRPAGVDPDVDDIPPCIENVAQTFPVQLGPMPTTTEDFHGDGAGSKVHVVRTDRLLVHDDESAVAEHSGEHQFSGRNVAVRAAFVRERDSSPCLSGLPLPANSVMSGAGQPESFLAASRSHAHKHGLTSVPGRHTEFQQTSSYHAPADIEGFCERLLTQPSGVTTDEIVRVRREPFSGHVYNLDTSQGWYIGNSIVTHNCRCGPAPADTLPAAVYAKYLTGAGGALCRTTRCASRSAR